MTEAICIAGLPGSGKSHLGRELAFYSGGNNMLIDDIRSLGQLPEPGLYDHVVVIDPNFCSTQVREQAHRGLSQTYGQVRWIFFANDPRACRRLVRLRDDGRTVDEFITGLSQVYEIPEGADVRPIWQPDPC